MPEIVHQTRPAQRIGRFQLLRHALGFRHLRHGLCYHPLRGLLDLRQMFRQPTARFQVGVQHAAVLLEVLPPQFRVLAQVGFRLLRKQQVRNLKAVLLVIGDFHVHRSFQRQYFVRY